MLRSLLVTAFFGALATAQCMTQLVPLYPGANGPVYVLERLANGDTRRSRIGETRSSSTPADRNESGNDGPIRCPIPKCHRLRLSNRATIA